MLGKTTAHKRAQRHADHAIEGRPGNKPSLVRLERAKARDERELSPVFLSVNSPAKNSLAFSLT